MKNEQTNFIETVWQVCLQHSSSNPLTILRDLTALPACHLHGPEHHTLVGSALLTAYRNSGGIIDLPHALEEMYARTQKVPGGVCGYWGACGAAISSGIFISIITNTSPLSEQTWGLCNQMTAASLNTIGSIGGPRCCKRNSTLAISQAMQFVKDHFGIAMTWDPPTCIHYTQNSQCIGTRCPFHP